jgi:small conductance mechanosensitive channel
MAQDLYNQAIVFLRADAIPLFWNLLGAAVIWFGGGFAIRAIRRLVGRQMNRRQVDTTLASYADSSVNVALRILLIITVLGAMGVNTFTFAGILTAVAFAIGTAWSGLLANFAAGIFMVVLRPFRIGDMISGAGVTGNVKEIGLFVTTLDTPDNIRVMIGNNKIFADTIFNYTHNPYRRVELRAQLAHSVDPQDAIARLKARIAKIPNVMEDPAPMVEILEFNLAGPVLAVRPFCHNNNYWGVYFATNAAIAEVAAAAGFAVPEERRAIRQI